jgi:hypothetical protein
MRGSRIVLAYAGLAMLLAQGCYTQRAGRMSAPAIGGAVTLTDSIKGLTFPKSMLLIDEKNLGTIATSEVESMAIQRIKENGGKVVDQDMIRSNLKRDQSMLKKAGDNRGAASLGMQYGADVIIVGEAVAKPSARRIAGSNLRSYEAVVTLRAIRTDNSDMLASASETATIFALNDVSGSSKALKNASVKSLDKLVPSMVREYNSQPRGSVNATPQYNVSLTVGGIDQLYKVKKVREKLKSLEGIKSVRQKSYTAGVVLFDLVTEKPTEELAEDLVINAPDGMRMQALDIAPGKIEMRAVAPKKR